MSLAVLAVFPGRGAVFAPACYTPSATLLESPVCPLYVAPVCPWCVGSGVVEDAEGLFFECWCGAVPAPGVELAGHAWPCSVVANGSQLDGAFGPFAGSLVVGNGSRLGGVFECEWHVTLALTVMGDTDSTFKGVCRAA